uniref:RNA-directed RNA polymerase n=1 Tax=Leviviridae sp. TaxID=2027243 RepID=A0A514D3E9_9VIRU|nr:MAG: hypothetical protein H1RhizoLitter1401_000002 [Leviviridae sp.]
MKSLIVLLQKVLYDFGDQCHTSTIRDLKTVSDRVDAEGLSFLTITLADFGKDFQKSLDQGFVAPDAFLGFRRNKARGLPLFLEGFLEQVFDTSDGSLLMFPNRDCVFAIRQICLMFSKIQLPCTEKRNEAALDNYINIEQELRAVDSELFGINSSIAGSDINSFLESAAFFGVKSFRTWTYWSTNKRFFLRMVLAPQLIVLRATVSTNSANGPAGWNPSSLLGFMDFQYGSHTTATELDSWILAQRGL